MRADDITVVPDYRARIITNGKIVHQWIYRGIAGAKSTYLFLEPNAAGVLMVSDVRN